MIRKILFLSSFLSCPQKKTPISVRFILFVIHKLGSIQDDELINNIKEERVLLIKPYEFADFYEQDQENVRTNLTKNINDLLNLKFIFNGKLTQCFDKIDIVRFKGYLIHLNRDFIDEILNNFSFAVDIDVCEFGKLDSVYSQTLYAQLVNSEDNAAVLSIDFIRNIFVLDGLYGNNSYNLSKKCVADPLKKINKIFNTNYDFKKIKINGDVVWIVADMMQLQKMQEANWQI